MHADDFYAVRTSSHLLRDDSLASIKTLASLVPKRLAAEAAQLFVGVDFDTTDRAPAPGEDRRAPVRTENAEPKGNQAAP